MDSTPTGCWIRDRALDASDSSLDVLATEGTFNGSEMMACQGAESVSYSPLVMPQAPGMSRFATQRVSPWCAFLAVSRADTTGKDMILRPDWFWAAILVVNSLIFEAPN